jgi:hypothetical protein
LDVFIAAIQKRYEEAILAKNVANGRNPKIRDYAEVRAAIEGFSGQDEKGKL